MEMRQLRYFLAVVEAGSFTAAARTVPVSQPALSLALRQLERELGTELFFRLGRRVEITPAGLALVEPARRTLRDAESARHAVAEVAGLETGTLSLCALPSLAPDPLAGLVGRFRSAHPGVSVELAAPENSSDLVRLLSRGDCELGIGEHLAALPEEASLEEVALGAQELWIILPPGWPGPSGSTLPLQTLGELPVVATPEGTSSRRLLDEGLEMVGLVPKVAVVTAQRDAVVPLVLAGAGAALVPLALATLASSLGATMTRPAPSIVRQTALLHRPGALTPAARRFTELATTVFLHQPTNVGTTTPPTDFPPAR